jgi:hypothetical protein
MVFPEIISALILVLLLTLVFSFGFRNRGPWERTGEKPYPYPVPYLVDDRLSKDREITDEAPALIALGAFFRIMLIVLTWAVITGYFV